MSLYSVSLMLNESDHSVITCSSTCVTDIAGNPRCKCLLGSCGSSSTGGGGGTSKNGGEKRAERGVAVVALWTTVVLLFI